jgi:hypothetical protein
MRIAALNSAPRIKNVRTQANHAANPPTRGIQESGSLKAGITNIGMKYIAPMPWHLKLGDNELDCAMFSVNKGGYKCEFADDGECSSLPYSLGTSDTQEPKFCFVHYFRDIDGDGETNYKLISKCE